MMKKKYIKPVIEVYKLQCKTQILAGSNEYNDEINAPEFDWIEKAYEFGSWELEEG